MQNTLEFALSHVDQLLRHPLLITLISLFVGKLILDRWSYQKSKRDVRLEKAFEFIDCVAHLLNNAISNTFGVIRKESSDLSISNQSISNLFINRFSIRIKSQAYLKSKTFWRDFERLMMDLRDIHAFASSARDTDVHIEELTEIVHKRKSAIISKFSLENENYTEDLSSPFRELAEWNSVVFRAADALLTQALQDLL